MPWKNGGGVTFEIDRSPSTATFDDFDWRLSLAKVDRAGPFSRFEGVERVMAVIEGQLRLALDAAPPITLGELDSPVVFTGESAVFAEPLTPAVDLNLMYRRGRCIGHMQRFGAGEFALAQPEAAGQLIIFCVREPVHLLMGETRLAFGRYDACALESAEVPSGILHAGTAGSGYLIRVSASSRAGLQPWIPRIE